VRYYVFFIRHSKHEHSELDKKQQEPTQKVLPNNENHFHSKKVIKKYINFFCIILSRYDRAIKK